VHVYVYVCVYASVCINLHITLYLQHNIIGVQYVHIKMCVLYLFVCM